MSDTQALLATIRNPRSRRRDVVPLYRACINGMANVAWPTVNQAIRERWSLSALNWIKREAWRVPERTETE